VIAGADGPAAIAVWAGLNKQWLIDHLELPQGIPSHDTIGRVLEVLQPEAFQKCFTLWLEATFGSAREADRPIVAIDGKSMRRSHDRGRGLGALHIVSAWATERGIVLGQLATEEKSNEITAIPELLDNINVQGTIVTIDAAGCQKNIASDIIDGGGDFVLALKGNQGNLHAAVVDLFTELLETDFAGVTVSRHTEDEKSHGRTEHREYYQIEAPADLPGRELWSGLKTIGVAIRTHEQGGKEHTEVRYYINSLRRNAKVFARAVRGHWGIENTLHWSLDVTFREDENRTRGRRVANNLSWLRRIAITLFKQHPSKQSMAMKRRMAGWSRDFLLQLLTGKTV
jgi:predicted transposase YbfD/YdcC